MADYQVFEAGDHLLQSGLTLRNTRLAYKTYGDLNAGKDNVILFTTRFGGTHLDNENFIGAGKALDPAKYFIIIPNLFGNGFSSSPSNTEPPWDRARFPRTTIYDNVMVQHRLLVETLGIRRIRLAVGWSMGALQVYQWAALWPDLVQTLAPLGGSARCSPHNYVFLEGVRVALMSDPAWNEGNYKDPPLKGLHTMGRVWAGWALSQAWYRQHKYRELGFSSLEDFLIGYWEGVYLKRDANNMLLHIWTWQKGDLSDNDRYKGDYAAALKAITARAIVMPGQTDLYFPPEDSAIEVSHMRNAELRPIPSIWGHYAGAGRDPADFAFIDKALKELLAG